MSVLLSNTAGQNIRPLESYTKAVSPAIVSIPWATSTCGTWIGNEKVRDTRL